MVDDAGAAGGRHAAEATIVARADHSLAVVALSTTARIYAWTEAAPWWTPGAGGLVGATGVDAVARP